MILEKKLTDKHFYIHSFERKESAFNNPNFYDLPLFVPQTGLPVGFYLRKKVTGGARWAGLGADLALLGALSCGGAWDLAALGVLGWVGQGCCESILT